MIIVALKSMILFFYYEGDYSMKSWWPFVSRILIKVPLLCAAFMLALLPACTWDKNKNKKKNKNNTHMKQKSKSTSAKQKKNKAKKKPQKIMNDDILYENEEAMM
jgi:flagellar biosynthesis component FlhA